MTLSEILQASELAMLSDGVYAWPSGSLETLGSEGVLLNGATLSELGIKLVKPSTYNFLLNNSDTYSGFKIDGVEKVWTKVGTQPRSASFTYNLLGRYSSGTVTLYKTEDGKLIANDVEIGHSLTAPYLSTNRRDIKFIIIHACGAGGGGGSQVFPFASGRGGGSGCVFIAIIDVRPFTLSNPLVFTIPTGGNGGTGGVHGDDGGDFYITSTSTGYSGGIILPGGGGGPGGALGEGAGAGIALITSNWRENNKIDILRNISGASSPNRPAASLPIGEYQDPTFAAEAVTTIQSFAGLLGKGGDGGEYGGAPAEAGYPGALCIYY